MTKNAAHVADLHPELKNGPTSRALIDAHIQRLVDSGVPQKVIALSLDIGTNNISHYRTGTHDLPLPRVIGFAKAVGLSDAETFELMTARVIELHGRTGQIDAEALATWAIELTKPVGDSAVLIDMWTEAIAPARFQLDGLLSDPAAAARIRKAMDEAVQVELQKLWEENQADASAEVVRVRAA